MNIQQLPIDAIKPFADNPRVHPESAIDKVAGSIKTFGWQQPIVVDKDNVIIAGHTRFKAARQLGLTEVPVLIAAHLSPAQAAAYRLADNRSSEETSWDQDLLRQALSDLNAENTDLTLTGFDSVEIDNLLISLKQLENHHSDEDACPDVPDKTCSQTGDVWCLDRHRVMCGDATNPQHIQSVMQDDKADLMFTDPPYNVDYHGYTKDQKTLSQDNLTATEFCDFLNKAFAACASVLKSTASLYICHSSSHQKLFQQALEANGITIRNQIIWAKHHFAWGKGRYKFQHEPIFYCHLKGQQDAWYGDKKQTTLWRIDKPFANRLHPTMKPVVLIERALRNSSQADNVIFDPFGGSGSTLIACEKMGRRARLLEVDPRYVDVIVARWQEYTRKKARLIQDTPPAD